MKNAKTRITRVLVIFTLLAVVMSAVLIPSSASKAGTDPILSGSDYGITYNDGVYTISIDAERLMEILTSKSFNKETLLSIMPPKVYDLLVNRDSASAVALLKNLIDTAELDQLKGDLPIDYFKGMLSSDELLEIIYVDKIVDLIDIKAVIASLDADEIEGIFKEGELEKLFKSLDLSPIITEEKIKFLLDDKVNPNALTIEEINAALKEGAIERLVHNKEINLEALMTKDIIEKLFDESDILTDAELEAMLNDPTIIQKIIDDDEVLNEILHNPVFLQDLAAHPEVIDDLVSDQVIVEIFIENNLLDTIVANSTIPAAKLKEIVFENDIDVADLITPEIIANLDPAVINSIISTDDIVKLAGCLTDAELEELLESNSDAIDTSKIKFDDIYPAYISADDIKNSGVIDDADMKALANLLSPAEKNAIGADIDFNSIGFDYIYDNGYITNDDIKNSDVIDDADITILTNAPYLSDSEKDTLAGLGYTDPSALDISVLFPTYITPDEIKAAGVISQADVTALANLISDDEKVEIALDKDLIDITKVKDYLSTDEILGANVISDGERETLAGLLSPEEKIELAIEKEYLDKTKINYSDIVKYISFEELDANDIVTDTELESLDAQVFIDAGLTASDVFNSLGKQKAAEIAIEIYKEGRFENPDGTIGNHYLHLEGIDFEEAIDSLDDTERAAIVSEIKSVPKIKDHIIDMIHDDFSILAHALNYPKLYQDNIITDDMILDVISSDDVTKIVERNIVTKSQIIDNVKDINSLVNEVVITKLPIDKLLEAFDIEELVDEVMKQNLNGLIKALNFRKVLELEAVQSELRSLTLAELKSVVNLGRAKEILLPKALKFLNTDLKAVAINNNVIQTSYTGFDIAAIEYAMIDAIPTFDKIAEMDAGGVAASFVLMYKLEETTYTNGFRIVFTGDTTELKDYAAKLTEYISFKIEKDGSITTKLTAPAKLAELYVSAVDGTKLPEAVRVRLAEIANVEFNKSDIGSLADAITSKLTVDELRAVLEAVDVKNIDDKLLEQLDLRESQAQTILDYAAKALNKMAYIVENHPETNITLSSFYDKTLADFYEGNGVFNFAFDVQVDVMDKIEKIKDLPEDVEMFFTNTTITHSIDATIELRNLYSVEFVKDDEVIYTAFRTPETPIANITKASALAGLGANGWDCKAADGTVTNAVTVTPAGDVQLAERFTATFSAYDSKDNLISEQVIYFSEFTHELADINPDDFAPTMDEIEHYTFEWDDFGPTAYENFAVNGKYTPITYTVTFVADGNEVAKYDYTIENYASITAPAVPDKEHYTGAWKTYDLSNGGNITVEAEYTPVTYTVTFVADGNEVAKYDYTIENYASITAPAVPDKTHYTGAWKTYDLSNGGNITVEAEYTPVTYTVTFKADGNEVAKYDYTIENYTSITAPAVPVKAHYTGAWKTYDLSNGGNVIVEAQYTAITYSIKFMADGVQIGTTQYYTIENPTVQLPTDSDIPAKAGYRAYWPTIVLEYKVDQVINAVYVPLESPIITYYITFVDEVGNEYGRVAFNRTTPVDALKAPDALPSKEGYTAYWPEFKHLVMNDKLYITTGTYSFKVVVEYEIINYSVIFMADGVQVGKTQYYTILDKNITVPEVPAKEGYTGVWEEYDLNDLGNKEINAVYTKIDEPTPETYYITFVDKFGNVIEKVPFTVDTDPSTIKAPATVPELAGYNVSWPSFTLFDDKRFEETGSYSFTVTAVYEAINYTATFMADGKVVAELTFTVETESLDEPAIPAKDGYSAVWSSYTLGTEDITIDAVYSTISYKVTFMADGEEVAVRYYTVENKEIDEPEVPAKEGYTGEWEEYTLDSGDKTVNAVYTAVEEVGTNIFWWITLAVLIVAGIVLVTIFFAKTKKKKGAEA